LAAPLCVFNFGIVFLTKNCVLDNLLSIYDVSFGSFDYLSMSAFEAVSCASPHPAEMVQSILFKYFSLVLPDAEGLQSAVNSGCRLAKYSIHCG
jgi:hypothetical protein